MPGGAQRSGSLPCMYADTHFHCTSCLAAAVDNCEDSEQGQALSSQPASSHAGMMERYSLWRPGEPSRTAQPVTAFLAASRLIILITSTPYFITNALLLFVNLFPATCIGFSRPHRMLPTLCLLLARRCPNVGCMPPHSCAALLCTHCCCKLHDYATHWHLSMPRSKEQLVRVVNAW